MSHKSSYIASSLVVLSVLVLLNLPSRTAGHLKLALSGWFLPLFGVAGSVHALARQAGNAVAPRRVLLRQIDQLTRENQALRLRVLQGDAAQRENNRLRQLLGFPPRLPWRLMAARVIARDPANWWRTVQIDRGTRDGLRLNLPVITAEGLVGRVLAVDASRAQVAFVGDPNCRVAALVSETRDNGIIVPGSSAPLNDTFVELTYLSRTTALKPGQRVVTSGLGGLFPKGILIGEIVDTRQADYGLYTEARVKLAVNLSRLEDVWVLFP